MRRGVRLAVDLGSVRIGVAACDPSGILAFPLETVRRGGGDAERLAALAAEHEVLEVLLGLPRAMSGRETEAARTVRTFADRLGPLLPCPLRLVDERLSTVTAGSQMRAAGVNSRKGRSGIDQQAAVVFLQAALDAERATGDAPGEPLPAADLG